MGQTLFLMLGYPGAGKTSTAEIIAKLTGAVLLSSDKMRMDMFATPTFGLDEHAKLYKALDQKTEDLLRRGKSVIYDANLNRYQHRQDKYDICNRTGAMPLLLWIQTPKELAKVRAAHVSRLHLWPTHEAPHDMFDRIASVIEEPGKNEPYVPVDGTKVSDDYVANELRKAKLI